MKQSPTNLPIVQPGGGQPGEQPGLLPPQLPAHPEPQPIAPTPQPTCSGTADAGIVYVTGWSQFATNGCSSTNVY
jgi:hypothetical protein